MIPNTQIVKLSLVCYLICLFAFPTAHKHYSLIKTQSFPQETICLQIQAPASITRYWRLVIKVGLIHYSSVFVVTRTTQRFTRGCPSLQKGTQHAPQPPQLFHTRSAPLRIVITTRRSHHRRVNSAVQPQKQEAATNRAMTSFVSQCSEANRELLLLITGWILISFKLNFL